MTTPARMDVKGKGKPRSRRRPTAAEAAADTTPADAVPASSAPDGPDAEAPAPEEALTSQMPEVRAPRVRDAGAGSQPTPAPPPVRPGPEPAEIDLDQVDEPPLGETDGRATDEAEADEWGPAGDDSTGGQGPPAAAEREESRRERRARELADEAAAIEAAALAERPRRKPSRRDRRAQEAAAAAPAAAPAPAPAPKESRRERRRRERVEAVISPPTAPKESRRERRDRERRAAAGGQGAAPGAPAVPTPAPPLEPEPSLPGPPAATASPPPETGPEARPDAGRAPLRPAPPRPTAAAPGSAPPRVGPRRPLPPKSTSGPSRVPPSRPLPPTSTSGPPRDQRPGPRVPRAVVLRQRRRRRRTIIGTTVFLIIFNLLVGGTYAYFQWRLDQINRVAVPGLDEDVPGQVMNVLLVGSDSRERLTGITAEQLGQDEVGGERSDTIMVLHVDPGKQKAAILSIPRDLYVPIAGTDRSDRVNTAFTVGGPEGLITTLVNMGIQVNHYAEVDFVGFKEIVDAVGGVTVFSAAPARDFKSGLDIPRSGCIDLDGAQALAYVRSRQYETLIDGKWVSDPRGDLGRIERQQDFIRRVMREAVSTGISNPITLNRLIGIGVKNLTVDANMSTSDITHVARRFRSVDPDSVETLVLPTAPQNIGGKDVLVLKVEDAQDEIAKINGRAPISPPPTEPPMTTAPTTTAPTTAPATTAPRRATSGTTTPGATTTAPAPLKPADLRVRVLNGAGVKGLAATVADGLKAGGLTVVGTGDATPSPRTVLRYANGQKVKAQALLSGLIAGGELKADPTLKGADVALVLGADYRGFKDPTKPPPPTAATVDAEDPAARRSC